MPRCGSGRGRWSVPNRAQLAEIAERNATLNPLWWARAYRDLREGVPYEILALGRWHMPYLYEPLTAWTQDAPKGHRQVWSKAAQMGITEAAINTALWFLDVCGEGVMYGLPSEDQIKSFVQVRVNTSVRASPKIEAKVRDTDNVDVKLVNGRPLYFRGSIARSKLREIPVGLLVRDEVGEMNEVGRELMTARLGASAYSWILDLGNPQFPETGIDLEYRGGDQSVWVLPCECGAELEPRWPDSVQKVMGEWCLVCPECHKSLDKSEGKWVPQNPGAPYRSFRMSQMISPAVEPWELVAAWEAAQGNATRLQEFYNSKLGVPWAPSGARITDEILAALPRLGDMPLASDRATVAGVDVGSVLHVVIRRLEGGTIWAGHTDWVGLSRMMSAHKVQKCAIDAAPETSKAKEFAKQFAGRVILVRYTSNQTTGVKETVEDGVVYWSVDRTESMDEALGRITNREEAIPANAPEEFYAHLKAPTRMIVKRPNGVERAVWDEQGKPDHLAHALTYSELVRSDEPVWAQIGLMA